jgi:hypothetical protein
VLEYEFIWSVNFDHLNFLQLWIFLPFSLVFCAYEVDLILLLMLCPASCYV